MELPTILVILAFAVLAVIVFRALRLDPVLGYLAVGALIGPHALGLVRDVETIDRLAELGVVFLLFSIGLGRWLLLALDVPRAEAERPLDRYREGSYALLGDLLPGGSAGDGVSSRAVAAGHRGVWGRLRRAASTSP